MVHGDDNAYERSGPPSFPSTLRTRVRSYGDAPFIEFRGAWHTGTAVLGLTERVWALLEEAAVPPTAAIGVVVRNRPAHAAAVLGFVTQEGSFSMLYAMQSPAALAADVERLGPAAVVADAEDWSDEVLRAVRGAGAAASSAFAWPRGAVFRAL
ncbi:hypothetical protein ACH4VM_15755 [Streptomyces sp. NPDC020792]|uniref:hypothetical protein n=1 Tax=Streptomyces sp. NPDC020792 TaxID=3365089 RepID=UPI00379A98F3